MMTKVHLEEQIFLSHPHTIYFLARHLISHLKILYVPSFLPLKVGDIGFGADPIGVRVASLLYSIFLTNVWILSKLAYYVHCWEGERVKLNSFW